MKTKRRLALLLVILSGLLWLAWDLAEPVRKLGPEGKPEAAYLSVAFYNVENLFDTIDDPLTQDEAFLPDGNYHWDRKKYRQKLANLAEVISNLGGKKGPDIFGLCEVENIRVLDDLIETGKLSKRKYRIIHQDSPDPRGIDVALVYDYKDFEYIRHKVQEVRLAEEPGFRTRDILIVEGEWKKFPIYFLVNHWPSRRGGIEQTAPRRVAAAEALRAICDSLLVAKPNAGLIAMGDFNDNPYDQTMTKILRTKPDPKDVQPGEFLNPWDALYDPTRKGTATFVGSWLMPDMILVNDQLINPESPVSYVTRSATIYNPEFIQVGGESNARDMPRRSIYRGAFRPDGYSDHFPIFLYLQKN